ncbi:MAG: hypothetical protein NT105_13270 [Verrucomicrobia bacterium]|nr:hypothetical protein [Verrucomicrobiota bacterium]
MHSISLVRFLNVNHSVRLMKENERRFSLPKGPVFPRFGGAVEASKLILKHEMAPAGGARLCRVKHEPDILDDEYQLPTEHHGHGLGHWGEVLRRVFGGASRE